MCWTKIHILCEFGQKRFSGLEARADYTKTISKSQILGLETPKWTFPTDNQNRFVLQSLHIFSLHFSKCESVKRTRLKYFKIQKQYQQGVFQPRKQIPPRGSSCEDGHWAEPWICPVRSSSPALWLPSVRRSRRHASHPNPAHSWLGQPQSLQVEGTYQSQ